MTVSGGTSWRERRRHLMAVAGVLVVTLVVTFGPGGAVSARSSPHGTGGQAGDVMARSDGGCEDCHSVGAGGFAG
jgi:hypothetical protein